MSNNKLSNHGRRRFLKLAGSGLAITGGVGLLPGQLRRQLLPISDAMAAPDDSGQFIFRRHRRLDLFTGVPGDTHVPSRRVCPDEFYDLYFRFPQHDRHTSDGSCGAGEHEPAGHRTKK